MTECLVKSVDTDSTFLPIIANFQNGNLKPVEASKLQCLCLEDEMETEVVVASENMTYIGEKNSSNLSYTLLAIMDKTSNEMHFVPINTMTFAAVVEKANPMLDKSLNASKSTEAVLLKEFGSKKKKRQTEQMEKMKMNVTNAENDVKKAAADVTITKTDLEKPVIDDDKFYLPRINKNASIVSEVYDLNSIITEDELNDLNNLATQVLENDIDSKLYFPFTVECLNNLKSLNNPNEYHIKLILYVDAIAAFFKLHARDIKRNFNLGEYPYGIKEKILNDFTMASVKNRTRPQSLRDKFLCYSIIILLTVQDYKIDLEWLTSITAAGVNKLMDISRAVGAISVGGKNSKIVQLKLPLPSASFIKRKKK